MRTLFAEPRTLGHTACLPLKCNCRFAASQRHSGGQTLFITGQAPHFPDANEEAISRSHLGSSGAVTRGQWAAVAPGRALLSPSSAQDGVNEGPVPALPRCREGAVDPSELRTGGSRVSALLVSPGLRPPGSPVMCEKLQEGFFPSEMCPEPRAAHSRGHSPCTPPLPPSFS